jgi:tRNA A-37 threonylcarbamoyl transferase component Bud32
MSSKEKLRLNPSQKFERKKIINTKNIFENKKKQNRIKNNNNKKSKNVLKLSKKTELIVSPARKIVKKPIIAISIINSINYNRQMSKNNKKRKKNNNKKLNISNILNTNQILFRNNNHISYKNQNKTSNSLYKSKNESNSFNKDNNNNSINVNLNKKNINQISMPNSINNYSVKKMNPYSSSSEYNISLHLKKKLKKNPNSILMIKKNMLLNDLSFNNTKFTKKCESSVSINNLIIPKKSEYMRTNDLKEQEIKEIKKKENEEIDIKNNNYLKTEKNYTLNNSPKIYVNSLNSCNDKIKINKRMHKGQNEQNNIYHSPINSNSKNKYNNQKQNLYQSFSESKANQKCSFISLNSSKPNNINIINKLNKTENNNNIYHSLAIIKEVKNIIKKDRLHDLGQANNISSKNTNKNTNKSLNNKRKIIKQKDIISKDIVKERNNLSCTNNHRKVKRSKLKVLKDNMKIEKCYNNTLTLYKSLIKNQNSNSNIFSGKIENYHITKELGKGSYATVKLATHLITQKKYAIKIYTKKSLLNKQKKNTVKNEIDILKQLDHIHIMKLYEIIDTEEFLYLVLEYINGGSLLDIIKKESRHIIEEKRALNLFIQIVQGIAYCHSKNICHRDIKLENILVLNNDVIKIIDFGFAIKSDINTYNKLFCGTPSYMSPEIVNREKYIAQYSEVWSLGVLLFAMLYGRFPFKGKNEEDLFAKIKEAKIYFPDDKVIISSKIKILFEKIFVVEPSKRPSLEEIEKYLTDEMN